MKYRIHTELRRSLMYRLVALAMVIVSLQLLSGCDLIRMKKGPPEGENARKAVARVNSTYLYQDELDGIVPGKDTREDSVARVTAYVNSWIRKQLLMGE